LFTDEDARTAVKQFRTDGVLDDRIRESVLSGFHSRAWGGDTGRSKAREEVQVALELEMEGIYEVLAEKVLENLSRSSYHRQNAALVAFDGLEDVLLSRFSESQRVEFLFKICDAAGNLAHRSGYSYEAIEKVKVGLDDADLIFQAVEDKIDDEGVSNEDFDHHYRLKNLFCLLEASGHRNLVIRLMDSLPEVGDWSSGITHALRDFPSQSDTELVEVAEQLYEEWRSTVLRQAQTTE
jgi:hypothetical protein